jgi:hypothetical protein
VSQRDGFAILHSAEHSFILHAGISPGCDGSLVVPVQFGEMKTFCRWEDGMNAETTLKQLLLEETETVYAVTEKLFRKVSDSELSWKPAT